MARTVKNAFRDLRLARPDFSASSALAVARLLLKHPTDSKLSHIVNYGYAPAGKPFSGAFWDLGSSKMVWCEKPDAHGMRDCGNAADIVRSLPTGWYTDNNADNTIVACVYRWGRYYVPALRDPDNAGPIALAWSDRVLCSDGCDDRDSDNGVLRDCARRADGLAELYAEDAREWRAASDAGAHWRELGDEAAALRAKIRRTAREAREARDATVRTDDASLADACKGYTAVCDALREKIGDWLEDLQRLRRQRAALAAGDYVSDWLPGFPNNQQTRDAFNDAAGRTVL